MGMKQRLARGGMATGSGDYDPLRALAAAVLRDALETLFLDCWVSPAGWISNGQEYSTTFHWFDHPESGRIPLQACCDALEIDSDRVQAFGLEAARRRERELVRLAVQVRERGAAAVFPRLRDKPHGFRLDALRSELLGEGEQQTREGHRKAQRRPRALRVKCGTLHSLAG